VQPFDVSDTARALHEALSIAGRERSDRSERLRARASAHPPAEWLSELLARAQTPGGSVTAS
jgi:trehalose 6-phosphate synthase